MMKVFALVTRTKKLTERDRMLYLNEV